MRLTVDIDEDLWHNAMKATGTKTKKAVAELALKKVIEIAKMQRQREIVKRDRTS